ncbi:hypothetical protein GCM10007862_28740 [Dyella lipolytica]|nr:hypothetical protein GCM10007862_28740 [Dyella lipolytica]
MKVGYANTIVLLHLRQALENLLMGKVCLTEGVREVVQWCWSNHGLDDELFRPFIGVDSETDRFPVGQVRQLWSTEGLAAVDAGRVAAEEHYRAWIMDSVNSLLGAVAAELATSAFTDPAPK